MGQKPVVAIAHDYLTQRGGAERVVLAMHRAFPEATIYTTLYDPDGTYPEFRDAEIVTSPLNRIAAFRRDHRLALPVLAPASQSLRIPADIVVTSTSGWAHGFRTDGVVYAYCHSPARWLYLTEQYLGGSSARSAKGLSLAALRPFLKWWDQRAAARPETYVANSTVVRERILAVYGREAEVFHPPHSVDTEGPRDSIPGLEDFLSPGGHFLTVSRLLPYKNVDQAMEAFRGLDERLLVIGAGPMAADLRAAMPPNVRLASHLTDAQMRWAYSTAAAVIAPSYEDFGITPLEGAAWGKPTIALRAGGYLDTIIEGETGVFIEAPTATAIREAVRGFTVGDWDARTIRQHAETFSEERFRDRLRDEVYALAGTAPRR
ncbi:glycosyl transferase [Sinomonas cellulolyticus]|uniref:D-inositol 3-phosphate glycosyltransferase n=1 Tax=Sinomonas cellulolyticus TaxID=2801916 RepID=A0ABS1JZ72_9MICC|nr:MULTISPECIES: glycosyltransferase [Sinomonas]MBL0704701.1 glycosyltransferase [Sinomonas cellulolyticus]GHG46544.1 glycosyl transferase [Sinomonas sp. KCTC 49339]